MTLEERLIKLASRILMTNVPPSPYIEDHEHKPSRVPVRWWRWLGRKIIDAGEQRKSWAIELRNIADEYIKERDDLKAENKYLKQVIKLYGHIHVPPMCNDCLPGKGAEG